MLPIPQILRQTLELSPDHHQLAQFLLDAVETNGRQRLEDLTIHVAKKSAGAQVKVVKRFQHRTKGTNRPRWFEVGCIGLVWNVSLNLPLRNERVPRIIDGRKFASAYAYRYASTTINSTVTIVGLDGSIATITLSAEQFSNKLRFV